MLDVITASLAQQLFWVGAAQWLLLFPLARLCQHFIVPHTGGIVEICLELLVLGAVGFAVILGPLYLTGYLPLPRGDEQRVAYKLAFVVGGLLSIPIQMYLRRRLLRIDGSNRWGQA
jgi:hypothetical protein